VKRKNLRASQPPKGAMMSRSRSGTNADVAQQLQQLLTQRQNLPARELILAELRESVRQYEERYGVSSACIHEALEAGELVEDKDVGHWIFQYDLLRSIEE
jgi:hypothetical protein